MPSSVRLVPAATLLFSLAAPAAAQPVADFYKGKNVTVVVSTSTGGGYDAPWRAG